MKRTFQILSTVALSFSFCFSQDMRIRSKHEKINVLQDSSCVKDVTVNFKMEEIDQVYPIFYDTELELVSDVKLYYKKGKRLKEISIDNIYEEDINLDYITSKKIVF